MWNKRSGKRNKGNNRNETDVGDKKKSKHVMHKYIILIILLAVAIVACPVIVPIIFMIYKTECATTSAEATLLATGIAIIGVAITAWTGLNIANVVNRKELEKIENKAKKINRKMRKKFGQFKKDTDEQLKQLEQDSVNIKKSVEYSFNNYNMLFLQELLKTAKDTISIYFYKQFTDYFNKTEKKNEDVLLLMEIEHIFAEVYNLHNNTSEEHELLISKANYGLEKIGEYKLNEQTEELVKWYLDYRRGEFNYYKGYCEDKPKDVCECFMEAIDIYMDFAKQIGIPLEYNKQKNKKIPDYNGPFPEIACYLSGSIGDSYSGIVDVCKVQERFRTKRGYITKEQIIDYADRAVDFCGCAAKWSEKTPYEREVYFRNLGCAYERLDRINESFNQQSEVRFEHKTEIIDNYKHAFIKMHNDSDLMEARKQKIYHTTLSYYERYFQCVFSEMSGGCLKYTKEKRKSVLANEDALPDYRDEMAKMISGIKEKGNNDIDVKMLHDYVTIARFGVGHNPHYTLRISLLGLSYTYVVFLLKAGNESAKQKFSKPLEYYIAEIEKLISYLDVIGMEDDYANELRLRYEGIKGN